MIVQKGRWPVFLFTLVTLIIFSGIFFSRANYEFLIYIGVILFLGAIVVLTDKKVNFSSPILWGLSIWSLLHMAGGGLYFGGTLLYKIMLIPFSEHIFRYDQFVHIVGFFVTTLLLFHIIRPLLPKKITHWSALAIVIIMAGFGAGALNEIIEFFVTVIAPSTGVGGYINTSLDLVADLIGAILAMVYIKYREVKRLSL